MAISHRGRFTGDLDMHGAAKALTFVCHRRLSLYGEVHRFSAECGDKQVVRTRRDIDTAPSDHYSVFAQVKGLSVIHQCDDSFAFSPNDICISDGAQPFHYGMPDDGHRAFAVIPRAMIDRAFPKSLIAGASTICRTSTRRFAPGSAARRANVARISMRVPPQRQRWGSNSEEAALRLTASRAAAQSMSVSAPDRFSQQSARDPTLRAGAL